MCDIDHLLSGDVVQGVNDWHQQPDARSVGLLTPTVSPQSGMLRRKTSRMIFQISIFFSYWLIHINQFLLQLTELTPAKSTPADKNQMQKIIKKLDYLGELQKKTSLYSSLLKTNI